MDNIRYVYHFVCSHDYTTMVHCVGVSIPSVGGITAAIILVVVIVLILLCCKHFNTLKKHDKTGQLRLPTTVSIQHMIIIIMTHAVHISLFIAGQLC